MALIFYTESALYSRYQVVAYNHNKLILIRCRTDIIAASHPLWDAWEIGSTGQVTDIVHFINERYITGIVDNYDFSNIRIDTIDSTDRDEASSLISHLHELKIKHFLYEI